MIGFFWKLFYDVMNMSKHLNCSKWIINTWRGMHYQYNQQFLKYDSICTMKNDVCIDIDYKWRYKKNNTISLLVDALFFWKISSETKNIYCNCEITWKWATAISFLKWSFISVIFQYNFLLLLRSAICFF